MHCTLWMVVTAALAADPVSADEALVRRALGGEQQAFSAIYRRHAGHVAAVVYRMLGQDADLEDIVQEAFVEGLKQLGALKEPSKLRSYLVTIAVRRIHARLSLRYRLRSLARDLFGSAPRVSEPDAVEDVHALFRVLGRAPAKHRIAWVLHRIEGYTLPEAAELTGTSLATVKRYIGEVDRRVEEHHASG